MQDLTIPPAVGLCRHRRRHLLTGTALIALGGALALAKEGQIPPLSALDVIPALIALSGILHSLEARRIASFARGLLQIVLAGWIYVCLENRWGLSFHNSWPVILILLGARMWTGTRRKHAKHIRQGNSQ